MGKMLFGEQAIEDARLIKTQQLLICERLHVSCQVRVSPFWDKQELGLSGTSRQLRALQTVTASANPRQVCFAAHQIRTQDAVSAH